MLANAFLFVGLQILCQVSGSSAAFNCTSTGYFPDPQNVQRFYYCFDKGAAVIHYNCTKNGIYDSNIQTCVDKPTVTTTSSNSTTGSPTTTSETTTRSPPVTLVSTTSDSRLSTASPTESTTRLPKTTITRPRPAGPKKFKCNRHSLSSAIRCFKNESNAWKRYLMSSSGDVEEIIKNAVNNTDAIFATFEAQRNSSDWFNPFDVLNILNEIGRYIALKSNKTVTATNNKMHMEVTRINPPYRFPDYSHNAFTTSPWKDISDVIELPKGMFSNSTIEYYAVSILYLNLQDKLPTDVYETNVSHVINSHVISSLVIPDVTPPFNSNVIITMKHLKVLDKNEYSVCAFWDFSIPSPRGMGKWSRHGCHLVSERSNDTYTTCSCNHLTNFAILMGSEDVKMTKINTFALSVITYVGCALSLLGSVAAIGVLAMLTKGFHSDRNLIHCNLLISIAISQTVFLAGVEHTKDKTRCKFTAIMLHYFYLVSFAWMLCEGLHLYAMVIKVFNLTSRVYHYVAFSWGTPAVVVLITAVSRFKEYGTPTSCWISSEYYTQLAFILPVTVILMVNIFILSLVMKEICKLHVSESSHIKKMINSSLKTVVVLFPLLGITWVFGLLVFATKNVVFQYIFAISNSLQGFFIFVLHCLFNSEIRKNFKRKKEIWKSLRMFEDFRRRVTVSIIPIRVPVTKQTTSSNERVETFEKSS